MKTTRQQQPSEKCLVCGKQTQKDTMKRGLCPADYEKYRRAKESVEECDREEWEARLVEKHLLAIDARKPANVFTAEYAKMQAEKIANPVVTPVGKPKRKPAIDAGEHKKAE